MFEAIRKAFETANLVMTLLLTGRADFALSAAQRRMERGDADSAGSTLRTIMVVIVVTAVVGAIGAAVRTAGSHAATCIVNAGC